MSDNNPLGLPTGTIPTTQDASTQTILDLINKNQQIDKVKALLELLTIKDLEIMIAEEKFKVLNLELITEYTGKDMTKFMVKNETWRRSFAMVYHCNINDEKLVAYMNAQVMLKMTSHKRKRVQEIINGMKNEVSGSEVIPSQTRTKRFFGMGR